MSGPSFIVFDQEKVDIGVRVITFQEPNAPSFAFETERRGRKFFHDKFFEQLAGNRKKDVTQVVLHHDGTRDSLGCFQVLVERGLSTHLMINYDGVVYQPLDLRSIAWHAFGQNERSVGIDINNPVRPDRVRAGSGRQVYAGEINGGRVASLGYTDVQYESLIAVLVGLKKIFPDLRLEAPIGADGKVLRNKLVNTAFVGIVGHWHVSATKWDPGPGFDWERVLIGVRGNPVYYPITLPDAPNLATVPKRRALVNAVNYFRNTESGPGGYFPMGVNQAWHTGVHLHMPTGTPVKAPLDGTIIAARFADFDPKMGSPNMVLIRHKVDIAGKPRTFYTMLAHLAEEKLGANGSLAWIRRFAIQDGPRGLPDSGDINAAPGHIALQNGLVALGEVPVKAGEVIGRVGWFNPDADGRGEKQEVIDFALFAAEPIFEVGDLTFDVVDEDDDEGILCNSRTVWKRFTTDPEVLRGLVSGGYPLAADEVRAFFGGNPAARSLRWIAPRHVTEWSTGTDFGGLFGGGTDFEWNTRRIAERYVKRIRKFLWWDETVTKALKLPDDGLVYAYHPIALTTMIAMGEARRAFQINGDPEKGLEGDELRRARAADAETEAQYERQFGLAMKHEDVFYKDIVGGAELDPEGDLDPESEGWMRWEQGEWDP
ncbi:MAG: N-acetylmuramoyl-L-alanine amidase [Myxococcales bacterium]|nr:N-acetylmuramoyl-L-alanine amidase [Myxococcales bacterium]